MTKWPETEMQLAEVMVAWLEDLKWEVYQEVQFLAADKIADIVAVQNRIIWIIEAKLSFSLNLISQCHQWRGRVHYVSAAIPVRKQKDSMLFGRKVCKDYGIGILEAGDPDLWDGDVHELESPKLYRRADTIRMLGYLRPLHKTFAKAGNPNGRRLTPFQETCLHLKQVVQANPGIILKDLMEKVPHHYSSTRTARACISRWTQEGIIEGIRVEKGGRFLRFYLDEDSK